MRDYNPLHEVAKQYNDDILACIELLREIENNLTDDAGKRAITELIYTLYNSVVQVKEVAQCQ